MEIVIVVLLIAILGALAFAWTKLRPGTPGSAGPPRRGPGVRGRRGAAVAARHDPMAEAVERHSMATDPREAAEAELALQAQANRVASTLHAREASALESHLGGRGDPRPGVAPVHDDGTPVYDDGTPVYDDGTPVYGDGTPVYGSDQPGHQNGGVVRRDGTPVDERRPAYHDEQGRPVYDDYRPRR
jgi:hypothetical protein